VADVLSEAPPKGGEQRASRHEERADEKDVDADDFACEGRCW
jgi:hypothetical protein